MSQGFLKDLSDYYERKQAVKKNSDPDMGEAEKAPPDRDTETEHYKNPEAGPMNANWKK